MKNSSRMYCSKKEFFLDEPRCDARPWRLPKLNDNKADFEIARGKREFMIGFCNIVNLQYGIV